jgi:hypothetical protein
MDLTMKILVGIALTSMGFLVTCYAVAVYKEVRLNRMIARLLEDE